MSEIQAAIREVLSRPEIYREADGTYKIDIDARFLEDEVVFAWASKLKLSPDGRDFELTLTDADLNP